MVRISYNKLWKLMIDKKMNRSQLRLAAGLSSGALAKMGKDEPVSLSVLLKVCEVLDCTFGDIVDAVPQSSGHDEGREAADV